MCWFKKLVLPHPMEPENPMQTMDNVDVAVTLTKWLTDWQVPVEFWNFWRTKIIIKVDPTFAVQIAPNVWIAKPAGSWDENGVRHLAIRPSWLNAGVIAHEQCHNSYSLLTNEQKAEFTATYTPLIKTDRYIKLLYSLNTYGLTSVIEGHADVYRYIGQSMPATLKRFYPKLF